ncbi:hypothetical protein [Citricoccus nitrophenolicus]|uniref:hypothetical protein n=1 Tax=Citricoccus nitrophenolicus TaxID=863575 RepID=UPI0031F16515
MSEQIHVVDLDTVHLENLGEALGPFDGDRSGAVVEIVDRQGRAVVHGGQPAHEFDELCRSVIEAQGMMVITITETATTVRSGRLLDTPGEDPGTSAFVWFSRYGILTARPLDGGYRLELERAGGIYRFLVDLLGFGPRPEPTQELHLEVSRPVMQGVTLEDSQSTEGRAARESLAGLLDAAWPEVATDLRGGRCREITAALQFNGARGLAEFGTWYLDTPSGLLVHQQEQRTMRRNRDLLVSTPAWQLWAELLATLPQADDVESWLLG